MAQKTYKPRKRWRNFREEYPPASSMGEILASALPRLGIDADQIRISHLWECWPDVMGPELALLARPLGQHKGTLLLGCEDNMLMQEISLQQPEILERANTFMEKPFFHSIKASLVLDNADLARPRREYAHPARDTTRPTVEGRYLSQMAQDTPWARCYAAYAGVK